jgi:SSU ribosomal protein S13P
MARIAGINIPPHQHSEIGLTAIYGIGRTTARAICDASGVPYNKRIKDLSDADLEKVREAMASSPSRVTCVARSPSTSSA